MHRAQLPTPPAGLMSDAAALATAAARPGCSKRKHFRPRIML
jgi:hypothetical protein